MNLSVSKNINSKILIVLSLLMVLFKILCVVKLVPQRDFGSITNGDNYINVFKIFRQSSLTEALKSNTTLLYNFVLQSVDYFSPNVETTFLIVNYIAALFILFFGIWFLLKVCKDFGLEKWLSFLLVSVFAFQVAANYFFYRFMTNDDMFMGTIYIVLVYNLYQFHQTGRTKNLVFMFLFWALSFCIRELPIFLVPIIGISLFIKKPKAKPLFAALGVFLGIIFLFHGLSLISGNGFAFLDKNPSADLNWTQHNYLAISRIEEQGHFFKMRYDAVWRAASFADVSEYLRVHGKDSLPKTMLQAFQKSPYLFIKMALFNALNLVKFYFKYLSFLVFLPFVIKPLRNYYFTYFLIFAAIVATVAYSYLEMRWFSGIEILLYSGVACMLALGNFKNKPIFLYLCFIFVLLGDIKMFLDLS